MDRDLQRAQEAQRSSKRVALAEAWTDDLVRDLTALANSGGGVVVVSAPVRRSDVAAAVTQHVPGGFEAFSIHSLSRNGADASAILVGEAEEEPLALAGGEVVFRHGGRSEPATARDIASFVDRRLRRVRRDWLTGIRRVMSAPRGAEIVAIERALDETGAPTRIRIATDTDAPVYGLIDPDATHPYRQKELLAELRERLPDVELNQYVMQAIRRVHDISPETRPDFAYRGKFDPAPHYSEDFLEWIVEQHGRDARFFEKARMRYRELVRPRRAY